MNCKNCKRQGCSFAGKSHEMSFECRMYVGKTNADRIRAMTDEELAEQLYFLRLDALRLEGFEGFIETKDEVLDWLRQEANDVGQ